MRPKLIALLAVSAVALVGCASSNASGEPAASPVESPSANALVMSSEEADESSVAVDPADVVLTKEEAREAFLRFMEPSFSGWTGDMPDEDALVSAAMLACEKLESGIAFRDVESIKGSTLYGDVKRSDQTPEQMDKVDSTPLYLNNMRIVNAARSSFCLEQLK